MRISVALYLFYAITFLVSLGFKSFSDYQPTNDENSTSSLPPIHQNNLSGGDDSSFREILFVASCGSGIIRLNHDGLPTGEGIAGGSIPIPQMNILRSLPL